MAENFQEFLQDLKFEKYLNKLNKKLNKKTIVVYGAGSLFKYVKEKYDLSHLNIIAISDIKYTEKDEVKECLGYKIVSKNNITKLNPDYILVATQRYLGIIEDFELNVCHGTKIKVLPLFRQGIWKLIKEIWKG